MYAVVVYDEHRRAWYLYNVTTTYEKAVLALNLALDEWGIAEILREGGAE